MVTPATTINIINEERDPRDLMDTSMAIKVVKFGGSSLTTGQSRMQQRYMAIRESTSSQAILSTMPFFIHVSILKSMVSR